MLSFSIIINTLNRAALLRKTLQSFRWIKYGGEFEVIVVNGPSTDDTAKVVDEWSPHIRAGTCDVANLSVSRNIGICMAQGDVVAFIDDDAIPEPEWIAQLEAAYDSAEIGGAGGGVFDQTGYSYQYKYSTATRLGNANWTATSSAENFCFPGSFEFPYLQGTNASFRRSALLEVGGFDEEIEYYLDETEVCCRLVDAGYVIRQLANAFVHHKFAPSHVRDDNRINRYRYPVIKNKIYFSLRHGRPYVPLGEIMEDNLMFSRGREHDVEFHIEAGRLDEAERKIFADENERAWTRGIQAGMSDSIKLIDPAKLDRHADAFRPFTVIDKSTPLSILLVSKDFPPMHCGGVATLSKELAQALAADGHIVHVVTQSRDINRVDLENGVWVHRMLVETIERPPRALSEAIPQHVWDWSATALKEARRIASHRRIDVVEAPIWDCEGVAFLFDGRWPLVTSLQTTIHFWLDSHSEYREDEAWMSGFGTPMMALERTLMLGSDGIRSISSAIRRDIEAAYDIEFDAERIAVQALGLADLAPEADSLNVVPEVLFVGRLEARKGIDVLLAAIPLVLGEIPDARFSIVGDDTLVGPDGRTYKETFLTGGEWDGAVRFEGRMDDTALPGAYSRCDVFVAPSRFESFGLVFLEAMRAAKPVIGCDVGGMPEVIDDGKSGLLVPPGDPRALADAIISLLRDSARRRQMGRAGRERFLSHFTSGRMAQESESLYARAIEIHSRTLE